MYLSQKVKIPVGSKGVSVKKIKGIPYVYYAYDRVYDKERKYTVPRNTTIGKGVPGEDGMMFPNRNYFRYFPDEAEPESGSTEPERSGCAGAEKKAGAEYLRSSRTQTMPAPGASLPEEIVAFLNSGGGSIFIGIEDDGTVCGVGEPDITLREIDGMVKSDILPDCRDLVSLGTRFLQRRHVVAIDVQPGRSLFYLKKQGRTPDGCLIRDGTGCRAMSADEIEARQGGKPRPGDGVRRLPLRSEVPSFRILRIMLEEKMREQERAESERLLSLITENGRLSELLADRNGISVKVVRFAGREKGDAILSRNEFGGRCLLLAMQHACWFCTEVLNITGVTFSHGVRQDHPLFDSTAFREAWFNACLHNLWDEGTPPAVYVFTDRLEIISTGGLPAGLSREEFFRGVSRPVNEALFRLSELAGLREDGVHGVSAVVRAYGRGAYEFLRGSIRVVIPFDHESGN